MSKTLLLVGGGHTHVAVITQYMERLRLAGYRVVLIDPASFWYGGMPGALLSGAIDGGRLRLGLRGLCEAHGVVYRADRAIGLEPRHRRVWLASGAMQEYEAVSLDVGCENPVEVFDDRHHEIQVWRSVSVQDLAHLREALVSGAGRDTRVAVVGEGRRAAELVTGLSAPRAGFQIRLAWYLPENRLVAQAPAGVERRLARELAARGVDVVTRTPIEATGEHSLRSRDGRYFGIDHLVLAAGMRAGRFVHAGGLATEASGLYVTRRLQSPSDPRVHAVGSCARVLGQRPASGLDSEAQARVLAHNLAAAATRRPFVEYRPRRSGSAIDMGDDTALAWWGRFWRHGPGAARRRARRDRVWLERIAAYSKLEPGRRR